MVGEASTRYGISGGSRGVSGRGRFAVGWIVADGHGYGIMQARLGQGQRVMAGTFQMAVAVVSGSPPVQRDWRETHALPNQR